MENKELADRLDIDELSVKRLCEIEAHSKYKTGILTVARGQCPRGVKTFVFCVVCIYGHILECHYPMSCYAARCQHYLNEVETEVY